MPLKKKKRAVGIDIGTSYIKIVTLLYDDKNIEIEHVIVQKTPKQMVVNGMIQYPDDLGEIVLGLLQEYGIKAKHASLSIPSGEETAFLKWTNVPNLKPKELKKAVDAIVEDEFSHPPENLYYNWEVLGENTKEKLGALDLLMVGVLRPSMDAALGFMRKTKLKPYYAEVDVFSSIRTILSESELKGSDLNRMVVDIRSNDTVLSFIQNGKFVYTRSIPLGSTNFIQQIVDIRGVSFKEAEEDILLNGGVSDNPYDLSFEKQTTAEILNILVDTLTDEIRTTLDFFKDYSKGEVDDTIIVGGGALIQGIAPYMESRLMMPVSISTPKVHQNITYKEEVEEVWPLLHVAFGLAIKEVRDNV